MKKSLTEKQREILKENIDKMSRSDEQFIFMLFKNPNGSDNITKYSFNIPADKLEHYLMESLKSGELKENES